MLMIVGIIYLEMHIPQVSSLKEKRSILKSLKQKIHNEFNVSIAEVDYLDKWQRSAFGICIISNERAHFDSQVSKLESFIEHENRIVMTHWDLRLA